MIDRWLFHWPHLVWKMPDAFEVLAVLMHMIREPGAQSAGAQEADISPARELSQATQDCHCAGTICDVFPTPHPSLTPPQRET